MFSKCGHGHRLLAVALMTSLAGCGGGAMQLSSPSSAVPRATSARIAGGRTGISGVVPTALSGWARGQKTAESDRRAGRPGPSYARVAAPRTWQSQRHTPRGASAASALVLYDTAGQFGFLGELYAMATANLAGHFGQVTAEPVTAYTAGQVNAFTATIYIGSTFYDSTNDQIPPVFYTDVIASAHPVIWMNDNIWNFANAIGQSQFENTYGWDATSSFFAPSGSVGDVTQVTYKTQPLTRTIPSGADGGILHPDILGGSFPSVTTLATALDSSTNTTFPWAIRSGNLTYIGEIPFDYVTESSRIVALEDLLFDALAPNTVERHRMMLRLEDLSAADDPKQLMSVAQFLFNQGIPYGFNVIPLYTDPLGAYHNGVATTIPLTQAPAFVKVIKYMLGHGGVEISEGYTHQFSNVQNPYTGASGDDAEFFLAHVDASNNVVWDGPVPSDSSTSADLRVTSAVAAFTSAGLRTPTLWVTPHYFATDVDYHAIAQHFPARYERSLYFSGVLANTAVNHSTYIGEFFPYAVQDVYGTTVIPENLGDYEPVSANNNPIRLPADLINNAKLNLAVRDGFASFFYDPSYGVTPLQQTISGIESLGYTPVAPSPSL